MSSTAMSLLGFFIKALPHKWNDAVLGFCAGVMLAAAVIGLIVSLIVTAVRRRGHEDARETAEEFVSYYDHNGTVQ